MLVVALIACVGLGLFTSGEYVLGRQRSEVAVAAALSDDEINTGSILYMPYEGKICRQILFDNQTGLLSDNGRVDCETAAYRSLDNTPKSWSFARLRVISTGFRDR